MIRSEKRAGGSASAVARLPLFACFPLSSSVCVRESERNRETAELACRQQRESTSGKEMEDEGRAGLQLRKERQRERERDEARGKGLEEGKHRETTESGGTRLSLSLSASISQPLVSISASLPLSLFSFYHVSCCHSSFAVLFLFPPSLTSTSTHSQAKSTQGVPPSPVALLTSAAAGAA